jgi:signal transduction histidine kinase
MQQQIQQSNEELTVAKRMVEEAGEKKLAFMRDMSHQIRTPLNIISGFAQVLRDSHSTITPEEVKSVTQEILRNSHDLSTIISHLVSAATIEGLTTISRNDLVNCNELCHQAAAKLTLRHPETVKLDIDVKVPDSLQIRTNRDCAQEIIDELMHNANKFTKKGKITISCQRLDSNHIAFTITDTGVGIPPEKREQIFAPFTKLNSFNEGLGLGLPLCLQKARLLGGDLTLDTTYYSGTRLVFTLPSEL